MAEGLKGEAAEELGNAISMEAVVILGAIIDEHDHHEHGDVGQNDQRNEPGSPVGVVRVQVVGSNSASVVVLVAMLPGRSPLWISIPNHSSLSLAS